MFYRSTNSQDPATIDVEQLDGEILRRDIKHLVRQLVNDDKGADAPLLKESFVVAIQGAWGVGKTYASWALINHLSKQKGFDDEEKFHVFSFELLPFGNINESVGSILGSISKKLWETGVLDVRKELKQMAIDASATHEMNAGVSLFGLSLSRKITVDSRYRDNKNELRNKFKGVSEKGHRFLIMLDDLDRMKPEEVVIITRMIENFRDIPGVIFVLPFFRNAVAGSINEELKLDEASSHVFLRKFIKASLTIELSLENLKHSFIAGEFQEGESGATNTAVHSHFGMNSSELAWYVLLHIIILRETIGAIGGDHSGSNVNTHYNNNEASSYLFKLAQFLGKAKNPNVQRDVSSLPYATDGKFKRYGEVYFYLSDQGNFEATFSALQSLLNEEPLTNYIYTSPDLIEALRSSAEIDFDQTRADASTKSMVFEEVMLPYLKESANEPKVTASYSRRDMQQLSNAIWRDPEFEIVEDPKEFLKLLITIVRKRFTEFR